MPAKFPADLAARQSIFYDFPTDCHGVSVFPGISRMGMFDWMFGAHRKRVRPNVTIRLSGQAMWNGLIEEITATRDAVRVITAHFPDELGEVVERLKAKRIPFRPWPVPRNLIEAHRELSLDRETVLLMEAWSLPDWTDAAAVSVEESPAISIIQCHCHPLPSEDARVADFATALGTGTRLTVVTSLEHPLLRRFAGEEIQKMLRMLGMKEDEAITHSMVARRLLQAQQKVASRVPDPRPADSCEEWFSRNMND